MGKEFFIKAARALKGPIEDGQLLAITRGNLRSDIAQGTKRFAAMDLLQCEYVIDSGQIKSSIGGKILESTTTFSAHDKVAIAAFVISVQSKIYLFNHLNKTDLVAHSSFVGKFAKGAGEIMIVGGKVKLIHAHSGHFRPGVLNIFHVVKHFRDLGVLAVDAKVGFVTDPFISIEMPQPTKTDSVQFSCLLGEQEQQAILQNEQEITQLQLELEKLRQPISETAVSEYRAQKLLEASKELEDVEGTKDLCIMLEMLSDYESQKKSAEENKRLANEINIEKYREMITKEMKKISNRIEDALSLIDDIKSTMTRQTISVIYSAIYFTDFVTTHYEKLKANHVPAVYDNAL
jgi:TolA-binding protein